jgi:hypothetical protein
VSEQELDLLISRVVDQRAGAAEWDRLETLAASDPFVWRELARAQRHQQGLVRAVGQAVDQAERVTLPEDQAGSSARDEAVGQGRAWGHAWGRASRSAASSRGLKLTGQWGGWAAAAALVIAALLGKLAPPNTGGSTMQAAGIGPGALLSATDALNSYIERGKEDGVVIGQLPQKVLVDSQPAPDGSGYDVVYVRQILERARVNDLYRFSSDELGNPTPVRVIPRPATWSGSGPM